MEIPLEDEAARPKVVDGAPVSGTFRSHQVPLAGVKQDPKHLELLEEWLRSYRPEELFDECGALRPERPRRWRISTSATNSTSRPRARTDAHRSTSSV